MTHFTEEIDVIRELSERDQEQAQAFLSRDPELNLYFLGNMASLGFDHHFCQFWGDFQEGTGRLRAVLNRYMDGWVVYGTAQADWAGLARIVDEHPVPARRLQDNPRGIDSFLPYLHRYRPCYAREEELMRLEGESFRPVPPPQGIRVRRATLDDLPALVAFYADAEEMTRSPAAVEHPLRDRRIWLAERGGAILATALTNAELPEMAMIGGVYTRPAARGQGLSKAVCSALCAELLREGRQPVLYWGNPAAGAVYHRLGFRPIGTWRSVRLEAREGTA